ncbi:kinase-like domain-containing protein [Staphylotrichum tortipilum]|uniref:Kinase-like domain-containing protein n=1 Tax=Staphylotrichum tortipilum TaxID=2831512 RepID=A0AAN6MNR5_9PEZI|nr:kinase-like domain-containing protein [Staphylotrichum longicolle]
MHFSTQSSSVNRLRIDTDINQAHKHPMAMVLSHYGQAEQRLSPTSDPPDDVRDTWRTWERCVVIKKHSIVKSERRADEFPRLPSGKILRPWWAQERLRNEAATLKSVAANTTIPVPDCQLYTRDGLLHLEMARIVNGVLLLDVEPGKRAAAVRAVDNYIGSVDAALPVFPPSRIYDLDRRVWPRVSRDCDEFVLCHNDLAPQNIFVDPDTFRIVGIIDWEFAGYFPPSFELPLWKEFERDARKKLYDDARPRDLGVFGFGVDDLRDDRASSP